MPLTKTLCLVSAVGLAQATLVAAQAMAQPVRLEPGQPVTREIAAGERHAYRVVVKANQALHIVAAQLGADVVVTLLGMDGKPIVEMDSPTGTEGAESVWFVNLNRRGLPGGTASAAAG
jgi:hypothetical protein